MFADTTNKAMGLGQKGKGGFDDLDGSRFGLRRATRNICSCTEYVRRMWQQATPANVTAFRSSIPQGKSIKMRRANSSRWVIRGSRLVALFCERFQRWDE